MPAATRADQPTINSVFRETRRSSRRNAMKLESVESSSTQNATTLIEDVAAEPLSYVASPNIVLPGRIRRPRTGTRNVEGKKSQAAVKDASQTKLNFTCSAKENTDDLQNELVSKNEDEGACKKVLAEFEVKQLEVSAKDEQTESSTHAKENKKTDDTVEVPSKPNTCETNATQKVEVSVGGQTNVANEDRKEAGTENNVPAKSIINSRTSETVSGTRSQRMLLTVKEPNADVRPKTVSVVQPDKSYGKTKLTPGKSVSLQRNVENKLLISPAKRKQLPTEDYSDSSKGVIDTPSSPNKMSKKELFERGDPSKDECKKTELYLPIKYQMLVDQFVALETTTQILFNRKEQIDFDKIVSAVQTTTRRNFTLSDLAKLFRVQPNFYKAMYEKKFNCAITKSFSWVLCLYPILEDEKDIISASDLISRRKQFSAKLVEIVHEHHFKFLYNLNSNLIIPIGKILRWHPKFHLEKIPDVEPIELPEKPTVSKPRQGLNELIMKSKEKATEKLDRALAKIEATSLSPLSSPKAQSSKPVQSAVSKPSVSTKEPRQLKFETDRNLAGIPEKLRLKIMAKEAVKAQEKLEITADQRFMNEKLPNVAKVIRVTFLSDKRCAIPQDEIMSKCAKSVKGGISREQVERLLKLIMECAPDWLSIVVVQSKHYVKVNKSHDFHSVVTKIEQKFPAT